MLSSCCSQLFAEGHCCLNDFPFTMSWLLSMSFSQSIWMQCQLQTIKTYSKLWSSILFCFLFSESPAWGECGSVSIECYNFWSTQGMFAEWEILLFIFNLLFLLQSRNKYFCCNSELKGVHKKQGKVWEHVAMSFWFRCQRV